MRRINKGLGITVLELAHVEVVIWYISLAFSFMTFIHYLFIIYSKSPNLVQCFTLPRKPTPTSVTCAKFASHPLFPPLQYATHTDNAICYFLPTHHRTLSDVLNKLSVLEVR